MKLLLRTDSEDVIQFDVYPGDTFKDLSRRLILEGKVKVNLSQLSTKGKPIDMNANVMEYFKANPRTSSTEVKETQSDKVNDQSVGITNGNVKDNSEDHESTISPPEVFNTEGYTLTDLSRHLTEHGQVLVNLSQLSSKDRPVEMATNVIELLNQGATTSSYDQTVTQSDIGDMQTDSSDDEFGLFPSEDELYESDSSLEADQSIHEEDSSEDPSDCRLVCRLCAKPIEIESSVRYIYEDHEDTVKEEFSLADKINYFLPVSVSREDNLPKQICTPCSTRLEVNYRFSKMVVQAAKVLTKKKINACGVANESCPFCKGHMRCENDEKITKPRITTKKVALTKTIVAAKKRSVKKKQEPDVQRDLKEEGVGKRGPRKNRSFDLTSGISDSATTRKPVQLQVCVDNQQQTLEEIEQQNIPKEIQRRRGRPKKHCLQPSALQAFCSNYEPDQPSTSRGESSMIEEQDSSIVEEEQDSLIFEEEQDSPIVEEEQDYFEEEEDYFEEEEDYFEEEQDLSVANESLSNSSYTEEVLDPLTDVETFEPFTVVNGVDEKRHQPSLKMKRGRQKKVEEVFESPYDDAITYQSYNGGKKTFRRNNELVQTSISNADSSIYAEAILDLSSDTELFEQYTETSYEPSPKRKRGRPAKKEEVMIDKTDGKKGSFVKKTKRMFRNNDEPVQTSTSNIDSSFIEDINLDSDKELFEPESKSSNKITYHQNPKKRGRPRKVDKKPRDDNDKDWSANDELLPVKKRGRPKGSKNKTVDNAYTEVDCKICNMPFPDIPELLAHTLLCHCEDGSDALPCPLCDIYCPDEGELVVHVNSHSTSYQVIISNCMLCSKAFKDKKELEHHLFDVHIQQEPIAHKCSVCHEMFSTPMLLAVHLADTDAHTFQPDSNTWTCQQCYSSFNVREEFMHHFLTIHPPGSETSFDCPKCDQNIVSDTKFVNHLIRWHCDENVIERPLFYKCPACESKFKSQHNLLKHACSGIGNDWYCNYCKIRFPVKARYILHLQFHNEKQYFEKRCDICLAEFTEEDSFYDHIRFDHEPVDKQVCSHCNKVFKNVNALTIHMRRHQEIRKHKCKICEKCFLNAQTLREHEVTHLDVKPYQCNICGHSMSRPSRLRLHMRTHAVQMSDNSMTCYCCSKCLRVFPNAEEAQDHCENQHNSTTKPDFKDIVVKQLMKCEFCDACFETHLSLKEHRSKFHKDSESDEAFMCNICSRKFSTFARVATHKLSHGISLKTLTLGDEGDQQTDSSKPMQFTIPQYFVCEICNKECLHYTYLQMHRKMCHSLNSPNHPCKDCDEKFRSAYSLHYHRRKMHNSNSKIIEPNKSSRKDGNKDLFECPLCLRNYASPEALDVHMKRIHPHSSKQHAGYVCETCGKTFPYKGAWQSHCDAHNGIKRFQCTECKKRFTHKAGLKKHMKLHSDEHEIICDFCNKKFRDKTERANHMRAHTGERPYMCDVCGRTFHTRAVWLDHSKIHQDLRPHHCQTCGQCFRRSFALKSHFLIHTGEKPFVCNICEKAFRLKQSLLTHIKKEHESSGTTAQASTSGKTSNQLVIVDEMEYELPDEIPDLEVPNELEGTVSLLSESNENQMISFQNYEVIITKNGGEKNHPTKSDLVSAYESSGLITDEVTNHDGDYDKKGLSLEDKPLEILTIKEAKMPIDYTDQTFHKTVHVPIIYCKGPPEIKQNLEESDGSEDVPILQDLCQMMDEPPESK